MKLKSYFACRKLVFLIFLCALTSVSERSLLLGQLTQLSGGQTRIGTNVQSGTTYTFVIADCGKLVSFANSGAVTATVPQSGAAGLPAGCWMDIQNTGAGTVTLAAAGSSIDQAATLLLTTNQGLRLISSGGGYLTQRGQGSGSAASGTVTNHGGALTVSAVVIGNGGTDVMTPAADATLDSNGNFSIPGVLKTNTACNGCASVMDFSQGTDPGNYPPNAFSWLAPASIPTSYRWQLPSADSAGALVSDGRATPGTLSIVPFTGTGNLVKAVSPTLTAATLLAPVLGSYSAKALPSGSSAGSLAYVTDGNGATDCTTGGGSSGVLCVYNGSGWAFPGGGGGLSLPAMLGGTPSGTGALLNIGAAVTASLYTSNPMWLGIGEAGSGADILRVQASNGNTMFKINAAGEVTGAGAASNAADTPYLGGFGLTLNNLYSTVSYGAWHIHNFGAVQADIELDPGGSGKVVFNPPTGLIQNATIITVAGAGNCTSGTKGYEAVVADLASPAFMVTAVGGGNTLGKILCNGSNWVVF